MEQIDVNEALEKTIEVLHTRDIWFSTYSPIYFFTNEPIRRVFREETFYKDSALSVIASGDHLLNLISSGVRNIDGFDINRLTYFHFYLKCALIKSLSYQEFYELSQNHFYMNDTKRFYSFLLTLKQKMPEEVYEYYRKLCEYLLNSEYGYADLCIEHDFEYSSAFNLYASSEEDYERTRQNLDGTHLRFLFSDIRDLELQKKYDIILLSNILDYSVHWYRDNYCAEFLNSIILLCKHLEKKGLIVARCAELYDVKHGIMPVFDYFKDYQLDIPFNYYLRIRKK